MLILLLIVGDGIRDGVGAMTEFLDQFGSLLLHDLRLDDASQPLAKPTESTNVYFPMPPSGSIAWVSAYFAQSKNRVGVYLTAVPASGRQVPRWLRRMAVCAPRTAAALHAAGSGDPSD